MWTRNRIRIAIVVVILLFDAFIIIYRRSPGTNNPLLRCYPASEIYPAKDADNRLNLFIYLPYQFNL
jgi:hypothetical protein